MSAAPHQLKIFRIRANQQVALGDARIRVMAVAAA